ncbi:RNA polymerase sigma factor [Fulvivirga sedimenti]|uniref:RNA polymerase sigma factor n=1 Tax=Fulvivirga sedimenti TaxID=2879465 RepID=A0A9X1KWV2_9BACT|nr:RNA polymerase sigma factor [Fulvivirga sedimenti]MCA6075146.1 RNA polymerase sigma factor [Fulvivirga sedimenti]MCA6076323.1 RNA polymerase sigma factor [Fulvivirga sedimenti]MCA6077451.1 RNA polymerase sigma factor [Fulvivirga sedimenti]
MTDFSDNALMQQVKAGELDKLGLLFERYKKPVFGFYYNMFRDMDECEDLVQVCFMRILKYRNSYEANGEFKLWLFRIARNVGNDHFRRRKNVIEDSLEHSLTKISDLAPSSEEDITREEELIILRQAMNRLDHEKREILTLSKIEGIRYKEIGEIINCSENTVKTKVFRALKALRSEYDAIQSKV